MISVTLTLYLQTVEFLGKSLLLLILHRKIYKESLLIFTMNTGIQVYRKLLYYFENKIPIHFYLMRGDWKNVKIDDLNEKK